jgi:putative transposase
MDLSLPEIYATLLDEGVYLCSLRQMQRFLSEKKELKERRAQRRHPQYQKPDLLATRPNQVWSWDITKVRGPQKGVWYHLYVIIDIFSRAVVGWLLAAFESEHLAARLIEESCVQQGICENELSLHADRGAAMRSHTVSELLERMAIRKSHSRPYVSNDNPYSESGFKTMKYHHSYPDRFGSIEDARVWFRHFFRWYNEEHHHHGIALFTPNQVHTGEWREVHRKRQAVVEQAYRLHPERYSRAPLSKEPPKEAWICKPLPESNKL